MNAHPTASRRSSLHVWIAAAALSCALPAAADSPVARDGAALAERALEMAPAVAAQERDPAPPRPAHSARTATRTALLISGTATAVAVYGADKWWYGGFGGGWDSEREGWFGSGTGFGGVDKLGHTYSNYVGVRLLTPVFEELGNSRDDSVSLAAWSTLAIYTTVEVLDGFSRKYHFSIEDAIANVAGAVLGYRTEHDSRLDDIFDFRLYYRRSPYASEWDPLGDYSGQRYLLVVKADAFLALRQNEVLRYLEVAAGYGARGFDAGPGVVAERRRELYVGVSLNLSRAMADAFYDGRKGSTTVQRVADRAFDMIQFPTLAYTRHSLD
jgi:hypothetical protein